MEYTLKIQDKLTRNVANGEEVNKLESVSYLVMNASGAQVGDAHVTPHSLNVNLYNMEGDSTEDNNVMVEKMLNALNEQ